jgi:hypothetical protein
VVKKIKDEIFLLFYTFLETLKHSYINGSNKCIKISLYTQ